MTDSLFPERPLVVSPSLAATIGLEEATLVGVLSDLIKLQPGQLSQGYQWYQLNHEQLAEHVAFWSIQDISRISQSLRAQSIIHLHSAPYHQSQQLIFTFNEQKATQVSAVPTASTETYTAGAAPISPNWQPSRDVIQLIGQHGIPEDFTQQQVAEFVNYWRESGESQRSWGSKFSQHVRRQWGHQQQQAVREERTGEIIDHWQPSQQIQDQFHTDGIPTSFVRQCLIRFIQYHKDSGTQHHSWDTLFYRWASDDWGKREHPFMDKKQNQPMTIDWQPGEHTVQYLCESCAVDEGFVRETVAEFIHKWMEKKAYHAEWGNEFAKHVLGQWRFVQAGIERNPTARLIDNHWKPSEDCISVLTQQAGIDAKFIQANIPEFVLYWKNRNEARHSWDTSFIRHIKYLWSKNNLPQSQGYEGQQGNNRPTSTRSRSLTDDLSDTSWAV